MPAAGATPPDHLPALDGLRGVAIIAVVLHNLRQITASPGDPLTTLWVQLLDRGWIGVQLFFALSGFLITRILLRTTRASNYYSAFFARRALRILPLYYATLLLWLVLFPALGWLPPHDTATDGYLWVFLSNWVQPFHSGGTLPHFWSLAVEEQFYLVWPFLLRRFPRPWFFPAVAFLSLLTRLAVLASPLPADAAYLWTPCRMDALALGGAAALLAEKRPAPRWLPWLLFALGALLSRGYRQSGALPQTAGYSLLALACACWIWSIATGAAWSGHAWLGWPWLRRLGVYSYGIYLLHPLARPFAEQLAHRAQLPLTLATDMLLVLATFAFVYLLAWASYHFFESWFLRRKDYFRPAGLD